MDRFDELIASIDLALVENTAADMIADVVRADPPVLPSDALVKSLPDFAEYLRTFPPPPIVRLDLPALARGALNQAAWLAEFERERAAAAAAIRYTRPYSARPYVDGAILRAGMPEPPPPRRPRLARWWRELVHALRDPGPLVVCMVVAGALASAVLAGRVG
ncbi:MAG TPA: hypothetical protein VFX70_06400 [Mycobacteriales bacterium]|nr:hypothetical protein [Mycobacteriales bacterium]